MGLENILIAKDTRKKVSFWLIIIALCMRLDSIWSESSSCCLSFSLSLSLYLSSKHSMQNARRFNAGDDGEKKMNVEVIG